jgi:hypothetical protein
MKFRVITISLALLFIFVSCGKQNDTKGIKLNIEIQPKTVTDELYIKVNYEYTISDEFAEVEKEHMIFAHFWRKKHEEMLIVDDHSPIKKVIDWKKRDIIKYSRVIFIPKFLDEFDIDFEGYEEIELTVGIYIPKVKNSKKILFRKIINIQAASLNAPEIVYDEGWWQVETDLKIKKAEERTWRWTTKKAVCIIENPKKESLLILSGRVDKIRHKDQKVIFKINEKVLEEFIPDKDSFEKRYVVTPDMIGQEDEFRLTIETDKIFIPATVIQGSKDTRELGIRIFRLYFRENLN